MWGYHVNITRNDPDVLNLTTALSQYTAVDMTSVLYQNMPIGHFPIVCSLVVLCFALVTLALFVDFAVGVDVLCSCSMSIC